MRATRCVTITASGQTTVITASGKRLGNVGGNSEKRRLRSINKILQAWEALPEADRRPGAVKLDLGPLDTKLAVPLPPANALVVRVYNRQIEYDTDGKLRYTRPEDYPERQRQWAARYGEVGHDFMWIPEKEWQALLPNKLEKGQRIPAPATFILRLFRYHLDPERGLGEAVTFRGAKAENGKLAFVVQDVTPRRVTLRLEGFARLKRGRPDGVVTTYEPALLAFLTFDRQSKQITRFEMIAFGNVLNTPRGVRPGNHPLGIAFELVRRPTITEQVVPRGGRDDVQRYLRMTHR